MKFSPKFYYIAMVLDVIGLSWWAVTLFFYAKFTDLGDQGVDQLEFFNNVIWVTWIEMIVMLLRRTLWVLIRFENEFFNNFEGFRDIVTIPPISKTEIDE